MHHQYETCAVQRATSSPAGLQLGTQALPCTPHPISVGVARHRGAGARIGVGPTAHASHEARHSAIIETPARLSAGGLRRKRAPAQFLSGAFVSTCTAIARF
jgi:hypothetical protein